jgi:hypothetical protein
LAPFDGLNSFGFDDFHDGLYVEHTVDDGAHFCDDILVLLLLVAPQ